MIEITRTDFTAGELRRQARRSRDANQSRRLLALALVLEGASRTEAARSAGMERQTLRNWVHRYNAEGIKGLRDRHRSGRNPGIACAIAPPAASGIRLFARRPRCREISPASPSARHRRTSRLSCRPPIPSRSAASLPSSAGSPPDVPVPSRSSCPPKRGHFNFAKRGHSRVALTLIPLPPYSPELNPIENVWEYLRQHKLANRLFETYEDIVDACCDAWNSLMAMPEQIASIATRSWAKVS